MNGADDVYVVSRHEHTCSERLDYISGLFRSAYIPLCTGELSKGESFVNGVNGYVAETHWVSFRDCQKADDTLFYQPTVCCPGNYGGSLTNTLKLKLDGIDLMKLSYRF